MPSQVAAPLVAARKVSRGCLIGLLIAGVLLVLLVIGLASGSTGHGIPLLSKPTLTGVIDLNGEHSNSGGSCAGTGGYDDMKEGASVTVKDEKGTLLATGSLNSGTIAGRNCDFTFQVRNLPDDAKFYQVEVSHRGAVSYAHDDLKARAWNLSLTLGSG